VRRSDSSSLRRHYEIERGLAARLVSSHADQRAKVYGEVYDELFRRIPDHPQLRIDPSRRAAEVASKLRFVARFLGPDSILVEVGTGDCAFATAASSCVQAVVAVDVSDEILGAAPRPDNVTVALSDGSSIPVPPGSVDVVYSDQLLEHLHPDDVANHLRNVRDALRSDGVYVCITPNRLTGPHDVSRHFDDVASGFHLREYSARDLHNLLFGAGFSQVRFYAGGRGRYLAMPNPLIFLAEALLEQAPAKFRRAFAETLAAYVLFGVNAVAIR